MKQREPGLAPSAELEPSAHPKGAVVELLSPAVVQALLNNAMTMKGVIELPADGSDILHLFDNLRSEEFYGVPPGGLSGRWERQDLGIPAEVVKVWVQSCREAKDRGTPLELEREFALPQGRRWLRFSFAWVCSGEAGADRFCYSAIDETELRATEAARVRSEERLALVLRAGELGIWDWHIPSGAVTYGGEWAPMLGYSPEGIEPHVRAWERLLHPDDRARVMQALADHFEGRVPFYICENRLRARDGSWRWILSRGQVVERDAAGGVVRAVGTHTDITARREAEAELTRVAESLSLAQRASSAGLWDWRIGGTDSAYVSPEYRDLYGQPPGREVTFDDWLRSIHPDDRDAVQREMDSFLRSTRTEYRQQYRILHPTRGERWVAAYGRLEREAGGRPHRLTGISIDVTDRIRAEHALKESELFYRQTLESIPGMFLTNAPDGQCDYVSDQWVAFTGMSVADSRGDGWRASIHPDDEARVTAAWRQAVAGRGTFDLEYRIRRRDGRYEWCKVRSRPIRGEDGRIVRWLGSLFSIQDLKESEAALRKSEEHFRELAEAMPQVVWIAEVDGRVRYYNSQVQHYQGFEQHGEGNTAEWTWREALYLEDRAETIRAWEGALASGGTFQCEHRLHMRDGSWRWHLSRAHRAGQGAAARWYGTATDIHDLKVTQETLARSEERLRNLTMTIPQYFWECDPDGSCLFMSPQWTEGTGQPIAEALGEGWLRMVHPEDTARTSEIWGRAIARGDAYQIEYRLRSRADGYRWAISRARPLRDSRGEIQCWFGSTTDIEEAKRIEAELRLHREHLQHLVAARTRELEESHHRLRLSERMAAIGTLAAGLGHDMGNLLMPMRVRLDTLSRLDLPVGARSEVDGIRASAEYLRKLAAGLRLLALDPAGTASREVTGIPEWWGETEAVFRNALPRGVKLSGKLSRGADRQVCISKTALTQVVFNLVQNAGEAMRQQASGTVTIEDRVEDGQFVLTVTDDGPGMGEEERRRCMEPFFTTKTRGVSTGLGLALIYGLVREAGGSVDLVSAPGEGTTFTIVLPLAVRQPMVPAHRPQAVVRIANARLRGFITAELRHLEYDVRSESETADRPDLQVVDGRAGSISAEGVIEVGAHLKPSEIRVLLREAVELRRNPTQRVSNV